MRIAVTGTHRVGKSSLIEALAARLPGHAVVDEPYRLLEDEGYEASDPPTVEDFERQLRRSIEALLAPAPGANAVFDRCPLDVIAYLQALDHDVDLDEWMEDVRPAIATLDLIVVVAIETPDRIPVAAHEDRRLRRRVDERITALALDDALGLDLEALEVTGTIDERVAQVLRAIR